jgi:hypothetical protein
MTEQSQKKRIPIVEGMFAWPSAEPALLVGKCKKCGTISFPHAPFCINPDCEKVRENVEETKLSRTGTLWTYTVQVYSPPPPFKHEPFEPYGIAMVDFPEGIRVLGMLTTTKDLRIGMRVETIVGKLYEDEVNEYITWMFRPIS